MKNFLSLLVFVLVMPVTAFANQSVSEKFVAAPDSCRFRANEWQVDMATIGSVGIYKGATGQGIAGDLGVSYYFLKYFGVGFDNSVGGHQIVGIPGSGGYDKLTANVLLRYPICAWNIAPYAMLGGGGYWDSLLSLGYGSIGGGIEYRMTPNIGLFADCRWVCGNYGNGTASLTSASPRAGVRFAF